MSQKIQNKSKDTEIINIEAKANKPILAEDKELSHKPNTEKKAELDNYPADKQAFYGNNIDQEKNKPLTTQNITTEKVISELNLLEPTAGEPSFQIQQNSSDALPDMHTRSKVINLGALSDIRNITALGAIEETELSFSKANNVGLSFSLENLFRADISLLTFAGKNNAGFNLNKADTLFNPEIENIILPTAFPPEDQNIITQTEPQINYETQIKLSHATSDQKYINNEDYFQIDLGNAGKNQKLLGQEMNIQGVSDDAHIRYKNTQEGSFRAILKSEWNSVKNIEIESNELNKIFVKNFVHSDINLTNNNNTSIKIINAKRGFINTEDGDDVIYVKAYSNGSGWSNSFEINTQAGDDKITLKGHNGHTISYIDSGEGEDIVKLQGNYHKSYTKLGDGNDIFKHGKGEDIILGGHGHDHIKASKGNDIIMGEQDHDIIKGGSGIDIAIFKGSIEEYNITKKGGKYIIEDSVNERDGIDTLKSIEGVLFGVEDIYLNLLDALDNIENLENTSELSNQDLSYMSILEEYSPLQEAINNFVHKANNSSHSEMKEMAPITINDAISGAEIFSIQNALLSSQAEIV